MVIRITGEEACILHMPLSSTVRDVQERLHAVDQIPVEKQVLLVDNKEVAVFGPRSCRICSLFGRSPASYTL